MTLQDLMKHSENSVFELPHFKLFWEDDVKEACLRSYHCLAPSAIADRSCFTCTFTKSLEKALPWTIKTSRASVGFFHVFRVIIQNDRQKLKSRLKIVWFTKGNFGWPFFKPEPSANTLISLNEKWSRLIISINRWVLFLRARPFCW